MIIDVNCYLGFWPFWDTGVETIDDLIKLQKEVGIDKSVICSLRSIFYDFNEGNKEVLNAVEDHPKRFIAFASVSLISEEVLFNLKEYLNKKEVAGLTFFSPQLFPNYGYSLEDDLIHSLFEEVIKFKLPVMIPIRPSLNQAFWSSKEQMLELIKLLDTYSELPIILSFINYPELNRAIRLMSRYENVSIETSGLQGMGNIEKIVKKVGAERVLFGSGAPVQNLNVGLAKIKGAEISEEERRLILGGNARELLKRARLK